MTQFLILLVTAMPDTYILGIESSCDETAAAVVRSGERVIANVVSSQIAVHQPYGGVVPELASREHLRNIIPVVRRALQQSGQNYATLDALAVTQGPGLAGALLVGVSFAKALAFALHKPLIAVNHLEGHIHAVLLEHKQTDGATIEFPVLALVVSGGHTHLYLAEYRGDSWTYQNIGRTRDDAAGEAFDKVAKLLGLGYPGGPIIDKLARHGDAHAVKFSSAHIKGQIRGNARRVVTTEVDGQIAAQAKARSKPTTFASEPTTFDFSFSGIKTAVLRYVETHAMQPSIDARRKSLAQIAQTDHPNSGNVPFEAVLAACDRTTLDLVASFQHAVVADLTGKTLAAARERGVATVFITGGVAANSELRSTFEQQAAMEGLPVYFPSRPLSTDNAAMIAAAAYPKFLAGDFASADFSAEASLQLR
jgi:N6-L-threonylcarbamoyladenine synthase